MSKEIDRIESEIKKKKRKLRRLEFELSHLLNEKFVAKYNSGDISERRKLLCKGGF